MTTTTTGYLGLVLAVPATKEPFNTGIYNQNLQKLENKLQQVDGAASNAQNAAAGAQNTANAANSAASGAQNTANAAYNNAGGAQNTANTGVNIANDAWNRANNAQGRADDAWNRTQDLYNRTQRQFGFFSGVASSSGANVRTSTHVNWSFGGKPIAVVTPETGAPDTVRMSLTNISSGGCDVVVYRPDTNGTGFNIIAAY